MTPSDFRPGWHLLLDLYGARHLTDVAVIEQVLLQAAAAAGARVIAAHVHGFDGKAGVTGVVLLAESHITVHTWPELGLAAVDIFMCGAADVHKARASIEAAFRPARVTVTEVQRGQG
jgi:S-adenosylmethionine decarboxylase